MATAARPVSTQTPNDLSAFWMPFTANRAFKKNPRMIARAKGLYYYTPEGKQVIDAAAGLWCVNAGHGHDRIVAAIQAQAAELDFAPTFQYAHPQAFTLATRIAELTPGDLNCVFFANSGSESVDTALKMALAYWKARGQGSKTRFIGRERGYHGVGFGGISVGGMVANRKQFGNMLSGVDHLPHTYNRAEQGFTKGQPAWGGHLAEELERLIQLHDASTIAAVIVEPMAGSTGVLPPPVGYLEKLRAICDRNDILLIFDEVITGFGRLGTPFASQRFNVIPDLFTFAKGVTSGTVPMGGVVARQFIHDAMMNGPEHLIEFFHGYTYSAHPLACAAALATLDVYRDEKLFENAKTLETVWADTLYAAIKGLPNVLDMRQIGLTCAIDLSSRPDAVGKRAFEAMEKGFHDNGIAIRISGETLAITPPLTLTTAHIDEITEKMVKTIKAVA